MSMKKHKITLRLGDWSHDGHSITKTYCISSNLPSEKVWDAYSKGVKKVGFDFCDQVAVMYQDDSLPKEKLEKLKRLGLDINELDMNPDGSARLDSAMYTRIFLFIAKLGEDIFSYDMVNENTVIMDIGGYGLFDL